MADFVNIKEKNWCTNKMMNKKIVLVVLLLFVVILNGCWDRRELESLSLVQTLGLDLGPEGKGVTITTMIAIPPKLKGGGDSGGGSESGVFVLSMNAPTIFEGFNLINTTVNREVTLLQNSALIIGEDLATQGIRKWIDSLVRYREMRRTLLIFVCKGKASDIMKVKPKLERNPAEYFTDLARLSKLSGMFPMISLHEFLDRYEAYAQESYIPMLERFHRRDPDEYPGPSQASSKPEDKSKTGSTGGGSPSTEKPKTGGEPEPEAKDVRMIGTAIFKQDKMIGTFDIYETQVLQLLTNKFREALLSTRDPLKKDCQIGYRLLTDAPPQIKYWHKNNKDNFLVKLKLEAELISIQSGINYTEPQKETILGKHIALELKQRIRKTIEKAQLLDSDVFGFGIKVRNTMLTAPAWDRYKWPEKFKDAKISVQVKVSIRRVGVQFQPPAPR
jgi:spore germination protein KC